MPILMRSKHEAFVQQLMRGTPLGWTAGTCYSRAGYRAEGRVAEVNASRLLKNAGVQARLAELQGDTAKRTLVTVESLCRELEEARLGAATAEQFAAVVSAITIKAKLNGKLVDKVEVGGVGDFAKASTIDEVISLLLDQLDGADPLALLDEMRARIERHLSDRAKVIEPATS